MSKIAAAAIIAGSVYLYGWQHFNGWWVVLGVVIGLVLID